MTEDQAIERIVNALEKIANCLEHIAHPACNAKPQQVSDLKQTVEPGFKDREKIDLIEN